jgi:hypothetical protein
MSIHHSQDIAELMLIYRASILHPKGNLDKSLIQYVNTCNLVIHLPTFIEWSHMDLVELMRICNVFGIMWFRAREVNLPKHVIWGDVKDFFVITHNSIAEMVPWVYRVVNSK